MVLGKLDIYREKNEVGLLSNTTYKIYSKWIKDLNITPKTVTLLEEDIEQKLYNIGFSSDFFDITPKDRQQKTKIDKLYFMKILKICAWKDTIHRVKKVTHRMGENICKSYGFNIQNI